jgi:uncharacterized membrane protein YeaQ/YmgE (transglycosylase-associated protein family)
MSAPAALVEYFSRKELAMIDIIGWVVFGLVAGLLARWLMPGRDPGGCVVTVLLGIAGAVVGGFVARVLGVASGTVTLGDRNFLVQLAFAVIGAIIILGVYRMLAGKRA